MAAVRHLHGRRVGITVHGDHFDAEALQLDDQFLAQLAAAAGAGYGSHWATAECLFLAWDSSLRLKTRTGYRLRLASAGRRDGPFRRNAAVPGDALVVHLAPAANLVSTALAADAQVVFVQRAEADTGEATGFPRHSLVWLQITRVALGVVHVVSGAGLGIFFCSSLNSRTTLPGEPTTSEPSEFPCLRQSAYWRR